MIILLDEYDTPMQEAYVDGFWDELMAFTRSLFNSTFKTKPYLERGIMRSLLLASGYLKVLDYEDEGKIEDGREPLYELALTNYEVERMFKSMVRRWFKPVEAEYNDFVKALLLGDVDAMNVYMNRVALQTFSYFETGTRAFDPEPERFYHGFVLGLLVELQDKYTITSNRESGFGRYDVMLEPKNPRENNAVILEFKVYNPRREGSLEDTVQSALAQIKEKHYEEQLIARGIAREQICYYGFAFEGKTVLINGGAN